MGNAIARRDGHQLFVPSDAVKLFSEHEAREQFTALVLPYTNRQLAKISGVTPEATRHWLDGSRGPNVASLFNVAQHLPSVRDWVALRTGMERVMQAKSYDVWLQGLYAIAAGSGPDAMQARNAIAKLTRRDDDPPKVERDTKTIDIFSRRARG